MNTHTHTHTSTPGLLKTQVYQFDNAGFIIKAYSLLNPEREAASEERLLAGSLAGFSSACLNPGYAAASGIKSLTPFCWHLADENMML